MRIIGLLGFTGAALAGGYAFSGTNDFAVTVHRPMAEVYSTFSGVRTFNGGFRQAGLATVHVSTSRPSDHELIYSAGDGDTTKTIRIAFTFEPGGNADETVVRAAIDVPPVEMNMHGKRYYLSEAKVERQIEKSVSAIASDIDTGRSPDDDTAKLNQMLDMVALASQPAEFQKAAKKIGV